MKNELLTKRNGWRSELSTVGINGERHYVLMQCDDKEAPSPRALVTEDWVLENADNIENIAVSGGNIYLVYSKDVFSNERILPLPLIEICEAEGWKLKFEEGFCTLFYTCGLMYPFDFTVSTSNFVEEIIDYKDNFNPLSFAVDMYEELGRPSNCMVTDLVEEAVLIGRILESLVQNLLMTEEKLREDNQ